MPRILTVTTLFPNPVQPTHGVFVRNRLMHLRASEEVQGEVVAPVPKLPILSGLISPYRELRAVPRHRMDGDLKVHHPRFVAIPKIGMARSPDRLFKCLLPCVRKIIRDGPPIDLIDAHYFYPDGVAAVRLGRALGVHVVITARGSDLNLFPKFDVARSQIAVAARNADGLITVSEGLKERLCELGVREDRVHVLRNGVDLEMFHPLDREAARQNLQVSGPTLAMVGNMVELKGHALVLKALEELPKVTLLIAGSGPLEQALKKQVQQGQMEQRVRFLGRLPHGDLARVYSAADGLVLASSREGWPNVLLEAMACGTPAVAVDIPGVREIVQGPDSGLLVAERSPSAIRTGIQELLDAPPSRKSTRAYAEQFSWDDTTSGQLRLFKDILSYRERTNT